VGEMVENKLRKTPYDELTYQIIGCAMAVHRKLGPGFREDTYQRDLQTLLTEKGISFEPQKLFEVFDPIEHNALIGYYIPDFVIESKVIVEIKALNGIDNSHIAQVIGYLAVSGCPLGLLINFGERSLVYRRILPPNNIQNHHVNRQWLFIPDWIKPE
jgi:GxxExxY protein